jgi:hypothetical protein
MSFYAILLPFFSFFPGYWFLKGLIGGRRSRHGGMLSWGEGVLLSVGLSLLLTYPFGFLNNLVEGALGGGPFQYHLDTLLPIYLLGCAVLWVWSWRGGRFFVKREDRGVVWPWFVLGALALAFVLRAYGLEWQSINGDEQELSLYAYHLVDGIFAGRNAYFLSYSGHSPLGFYAAFHIYQWLMPGAYELMGEFMVRLPMIVFGMLELSVFLLFARRLEFSKLVAGAGLLLLAVNTYLIFGSRLMIPQDGSIFEFFLLLFSYFFLRFLDDDRRSLPLAHVLILGVLLGAVFLVKFSAILLLPVVAIYWFYRRKSVWQFVGAGIVTGLVFFPVIFYNAAAYLTIGYMDVPFAKLANLFGISANSIMGNADMYGSELPPFFETVWGFLQMLTDQWSVYLALAFLVGIFVLALNFRRLGKERDFVIYLALLFVVTVLFFGLNGYRAYYAGFLTVPMMILMLLGAKSLLQSYWGRRLTAVLLMVCGVMLFVGTLHYTANTHLFVSEHGLDPGDETGSEFGRNRVYSLDELLVPQSLASSSFLEDRGWWALQRAVEMEFEDSQLTDEAFEVLVVDDEFMEDMVMYFRWYLGLHRDVDEHYLGDAYLDDYEWVLSSEFMFDRPALQILPYEEGPILEGEAVVVNHNGTPTMILRAL